MAEKKPKKTPSVGGEPVTEVQDGVEIETSAELSVPKDVRQHAEAPKIAGFVLCGLLGEGAYGQVWRSWQIRANKEVAIKVFLRRTGLDWILLQREVERLAKLDRHPNIVTLLDVDLDREPPHYVMDLLSGGPLQRYVDPASPAPAKKALYWTAQICDALMYVHSKGLIHCDLKPANILIDGRDNVRVLDFGQSRVFTESAASLGTLFYMAPEQAILSEPGNPVQPDVRWDVFAVGATLYAIMTGNVPHGGPRNTARLEEAPALVERLSRYREIIASQRLRW
ncbi:MAG: serine/threonine-protein kinase, partial [Planctomycetota bacterium]|nr:serine/threonine-protein kinase [Planctomycetota bacterium]